MQILFHDIILVFFNHMIFWYFVVLNLFYFLLLVLAAITLNEYRNRMRAERGISLPEEFKRPFSILVPAHNEELYIVESVKALLSMDYPEFEVIVCNDGSTDRTLDVLIKAYDLEKTDIELPEQYSDVQLNGVYFSKKDYRFVVVDVNKNSGKAASLNISSAYSRYPYVCAVDADCLLSSDSMEKLMQEFAAVPGTMAVGGIVRILNGCEVADGTITKLKRPKSMIEKIQIVEYFRAFLFGRIGMARINILMIISGAFGVFRRDMLDKAGGWTKNAIGEDIELVINLQQLIHDHKLKNRICFAPYPVCWTEVPFTVKVLGSQRDRWQRALTQCMFRHIKLFFNPFYGVVGLVGYPYYFIFELMGALIEFVGYFVVIAAFILGFINTAYFFIFLAIAFFCGLCISCASLVLAEMSFSRYQEPKAMRDLLVAAFLENFGYRQLHAYWRTKGMFRYFFKKTTDWGPMKRAGFIRKHDEK